MKLQKKSFAALAVTLMLAGCSKSPEKLLSEQLDAGQKYMDESNYENAIAAYQKAIEIDSEAENAYLNLSWIYVQQENYDAAIAILDQGLGVMPESLNLARIRERLVPTVSCSAGEDQYSERIMIELESGTKNVIHYSLMSEYDDGKESIYGEPFELGKNGEYHLTYYAVSEYGTKGEVYEKDIMIELDPNLYHLNEWIQENGDWFYYDENGYCVTGWQDIEEGRYFFQENGVMVHDTWIDDYYLGSDGSILRDCWTPDDYYVGSDGKWVKDKKKELDYNTIYAKTIKKELAETEKSEWVESYEYLFRDLNDDGVKELVFIIDYVADNGQSVEIWTYRNGNVTELELDVPYDVEELHNVLISSQYWPGLAGVGTTKFYKLNSNYEFVLVAMQEPFFTDTGIDHTYYTVDPDGSSHEVSKTAFDSVLAMYGAGI